jgi:hypothetical protein
VTACVTVRAQVRPELHAALREAALDVLPLREVPSEQREARPLPSQARQFPRAGEALMRANLEGPVQLGAGEQREARPLPSQARQFPRAGGAAGNIGEGPVQVGIG